MEITVKVESMDSCGTPIKVGDEVITGCGDLQVIESFDLGISCVTDGSQPYEADVEYINFEDGSSDDIFYVEKVESPQEECITVILSDPDFVQVLRVLDFLHNER